MEKDRRKYTRGVENPTNGIVDKSRLRESLVTTLMGNNPKSSGDETGPERIERPEGKFCCPVKDWEWELDYLRMDMSIEEGGGLVDSSQGGKIGDAEGMYASELTCHDTKGKD